MHEQGVDVLDLRILQTGLAMGFWSWGVRDMGLCVWCCCGGGEGCFGGVLLEGQMDRFEAIPGRGSQGLG